jgi:hypothetical protein
LASFGPQLGPRGDELSQLRCRKRSGGLLKYYYRQAA